MIIRDKSCLYLIFLNLVNELKSLIFFFMGRGNSRGCIHLFRALVCKDIIQLFILLGR